MYSRLNSNQLIDRYGNIINNDLAFIIDIKDSITMHKHGNLENIEKIYKMWVARLEIASMTSSPISLKLYSLKIVDISEADLNDINHMLGTSFYIASILKDKIELNSYEDNKEEVSKL
jgi:hypothetical protein